MRHINLHSIDWSWDIMIKGSLNNWKLLLTVMIGVLLSCSILSGTVIYYNALQELALLKSIKDLPEEKADVLLQADISSLDSYQYSTLNKIIYDDHIYLADQYLSDVIEGGKTATFFLTDSGDEHLAGKNDTRSFVTFLDEFDDKVVSSSKSNFDTDDVSKLPKSSSSLYVTVLETHALKMGLQIGDTVSFVPYWEENIEYIKVIIGRVVKEKNPDDPYWNMFNNVFMVSAGSTSATLPVFVSKNQFFGILHDIVPNATVTFSWLLDINPQKVNVSNSQELYETLIWIDESLSTVYDRFMIKTGLTETLAYYDDKLRFTKIQMSVVMVLVASVILFYVVSLSSLAAENREFEVSKLFSRGASSRQIMFGFALEALVIAVVGFIFGPLIISFIVSCIGLTPVLSSITGGSMLDTKISLGSFLLSGLSAIFCFLGLLIPAYKASKQNVVMQRIQSARRTEKSFIIRYYLDVLLLIVGIFLFRQLGEQGSFNITSQFGETISNNLFLLAPAVVLLGSAIVLLRLFPLVISLVARFLASLLPLSIVMSIWQISRNSGNYARLALLMILMTSLGVFASIFGGTLDRSFTERIMYSTGSDVRLESVSINSIGTSKPVISRYSDIPGVGNVSPVLRQRGVDLTEEFSTINFSVLAIHPQSFNDVAWSREDFSNDSFSDLLNLIDSGHSQMGVPIPIDSVALNISVKSDRPRSSVALVGRVRDANGRYITYDFGRLESSDWKNYEVILTGDEVKIFGSRRPMRQLQPVFPLRLMSVAIAETNPQRDLLSGSLLVRDISVSNSQGEKSILHTFDLPDCCSTLEATKKSMGDNISYVSNGNNETRVLNFSWTEGSPETARGFYIGKPISPVPGIVSQSFLSETKYDRGDNIVVSVAGKRVPLKIEGSFDYFPTLDTVTENHIVLSIDSVFDLANSHTLRGDLTPNEIWLRLATEADNISRQNLIASLNHEDLYPIGGVVDRREKLEISKVDPLVRSGWNGLLFLSFSSVLLLSIIGLLTNAYVSLKNRDVEFAVMRTIGLTDRQLLSMIWAEQAIITIIGLILGSWMGQRLTAVVMPFMSSEVYGSNILPPFVPEVRWQNIALIYLVIAVFLVSVTVSVTYVMKKLQLSKVLRIGES